MNEATVGFAMTGSFCTFDTALRALEELRKSYPNIIPIMSENARWTDTRFGAAQDFADRLERICNHEIWRTISDVEPIGSKGLLDALIVAPCTGNTLAKLAHGITDTSVTMACKAHLRNAAPLILAVSTNDALAANAANIGTLLTRKHIYFVPFGQDDAAKKPTSLVADYSLLKDTLDMALEGRQLQPILR